MAKKEQLGKLVLLDEIDRSGWATEYRAAKLGYAGLEQIVAVARLAPTLCSDPRATRQLMEQIKVAAHIHGPNVTRVLGIGRIDTSYYVCSELIEGKSLRAVFARCRQEGHPLSVDDALLIASKVCAALEPAHERKSADGGRTFHGFLNPGNVFVSYEAEVRVRGFGLWPGGIRAAGVVSEEEARYLAPEQATGGGGDARSDVFAVGALLFEALTGSPFVDGARGADVAVRLHRARLLSPLGEDDSLPGPVREILSGCLASDPEHRVPEIQGLRKSLDALLFTGDLAPTTFNLAFFMHSLFRGEIEEELRRLDEERAADYAEYLAGSDKTPAPTAPSGSPAPQPEAWPVHVAPPEVVPHAASVPAAAAPSAPAPERLPPRPLPVFLDTGPGLASQTSRARWPLLAVAALIVVVGGGVFFVLQGLGRSGPAASPPATVSPQVATALARVQELQARLDALQAETETAKTAAAESAKQELQAQARARGQALDPGLLAQAQDAARRKAEAEQAQRLEAERTEIEAERRKLEEGRRRLEELQAQEALLAERQRQAEEARRAEEARQAAAATPTATPAPPRATPTPVRIGALVDLSDSSVVPPVVERTPRLEYPRRALQRRIEGVVEMNALIDERGKVVEVQVVTAPGGSTGLTEAAVDHIKRRQYRPATKGGTAVKVWLPVSVKFRLQE